MEELDLHAQPVPAAEPPPAPPPRFARVALLGRRDLGICDLSLQRVASAWLVRAVPMEPEDPEPVLFRPESVYTMQEVSEARARTAEREAREDRERRAHKAEEEARAREVQARARIAARPGVRVAIARDPNAPWLVVSVVDHPKPGEVLDRRHEEVLHALEAAGVINVGTSVWDGAPNGITFPFGRGKDPEIVRTALASLGFLVEEGVGVAENQDADIPF